jgi:hypothetical protein
VTKIANITNNTKWITKLINHDGAKSPSRIGRRNSTSSRSPATADRFFPSPDATLPPDPSSRHRRPPSPPIAVTPDLPGEDAVPGDEMPCRPAAPDTGGAGGKPARDPAKTPPFPAIGAGGEIETGAAGAIRPGRPIGGKVTAGGGGGGLAERPGLPFVIAGLPGGTPPSVRLPICVFSAPKTPCGGPFGRIASSAGCDEEDKSSQ